MRTFQTVILFLVALVAFAFAQDASSYDATVYVTSTIFKVNTVTMASSPAYEVANSTTTIAPSSEATSSASASVSVSVSVSVPASYAIPAPANSTAPYPTGSGAASGAPPAPTTTEFTGAANGLPANGALIAIFAAGLGFLAL